MASKKALRNRITGLEELLGEIRDLIVEGLDDDEVDELDEESNDQEG